LIAVGPEAVRKAAEILAGAEIGWAPGVALESGAQWGQDRMVLSVDGDSVRFVAGSTIYKQDREGFLRAEFPPGGPPPRRASWLKGLTPYDTPLCLGLAAELPMAWPGVASARAFLERFSHFYGNHRTQIESAARELRSVAEALLALQLWPALLALVIDAMGQRAREILPSGLAPADLGAFLGRLLMGSQGGRITLARVPECLRAMREASAPPAEECLRIPHYRRMLERLERASEFAAPLIEQLRAAL